MIITVNKKRINIKMLKRISRIIKCGAGSEKNVDFPFLRMCVEPI